MGWLDVWIRVKEEDGGMEDVKNECCGIGMTDRQSGFGMTS